MSREPTIKRRSFVKLCASAVAAVGASPRVLAARDATPRRYQRVRLVDAGGQPLRAGELQVGESYVFHYPYVSTPCFLIELGRPASPESSMETEAGDRYRWPGGVGPGRSVVAFSAICAHKMSHPARAVSFINYRHEAVSFLDGAEEPTRRPQVIYCCSEKSVYDPADGARVLGGPARQPLAAILLEHDRGDDALYAIGTFGGEMFDKFFEEFGFRLALEYQTADVRQPVRERTTVLPVAEYCANQVLC